MVPRSRPLESLTSPAHIAVAKDDPIGTSIIIDIRFTLERRGLPSLRPSRDVFADTKLAAKDKTPTEEAITSERLSDEMLNQRPLNPQPQT